jgi:hypothetical protein
MQLFNRSDRTRRLLKAFRTNFLFLISDGAYPPHRQQRLYLWCQKVGLDWATARSHVAPEATAFLQSVIQRSVHNGAIAPEEMQNLQRLRRRLGLPEDVEPMARLYDLVERAIERLLAERAAYLSEEQVIRNLAQQISAYHLPQDREGRLQRLLRQQHAYARLMSGDLPVIAAPIDLPDGEVCHDYREISFIEASAAARHSGAGYLAVTCKRVMVLAPQGGSATCWNDIRHVRLQGDRAVHIVTTTANLLVYCNEPQYVATLIIGAMRRYTRYDPQPPLANKRLVPDRASPPS